jgi:hypothetical protein
MEEYLNSKAYFLVYSELINAARYRGFTTYQELALLMGLRLQGNLMGSEIGDMLRTIAKNEYEQNRPMLTALCIKVTGEPGRGFFDLARNFDLLHDDSPQEEERFWEEECKKVWETWKRDFSVRTFSR